MGPLPGMGAMPPMGGANPQNLQALAEAGDPRAIAILQEQQRMQAQGGGPGAGMPPQGGMPPAGGAPPGMGQLSPQGGGAPIPPDVQARRAQQLIQLLRAQGR